MDVSFRSSSFSFSLALLLFLSCTLRRTRTWRQFKQEEDEGGSSSLVASNSHASAATKGKFRTDSIKKKLRLRMEVKFCGTDFFGVNGVLWSSFSYNYSNDDHIPFHSLIHSFLFFHLPIIPNKLVSPPFSPSRMPLLLPTIHPVPYRTYQRLRYRETKH